MKATALLVALGVLTLAPTRATAQSPADAGTRWFDGEYTSSIGWLTVGAAGVATGATLLTLDDEAARSAGYPVVIFGGLQMAFGAWVGLASHSRAAELRARFARDPDGTLSAELERMQGVDTSFYLIETLEVAAIGAGLLTALIGALDDNDVALGVGAGLAAEGAATLALDLWAHQRSESYLNRLRTFVAASPNGVLVGTAGRF